MKKTIIYLIIGVVAVLVIGVTIKLAQDNSESIETNKEVTYEDGGEAGKLSEGMVGVTKTNYDEVVTNSKGVVVIDYYAPTCSYCIKYTPIFSSVYGEYKEKAVFGKFDVTIDQTKISGLKIEGTPTTVIFKDGKEVGRISGYVEADALKLEIDKAL